MYRNSLTKNTYQHDVFIQQLFASIPPQTAVTFTDMQIAEIKRVFQHKLSNCYAVDIRFYIPLPKQHFSLVLIVGKDKKCKKRFKYRIYQHKNTVLITKSGLLIITSLMGTLCMVEIVPSIKSKLGQVKNANYYNF